MRFYDGTFQAADMNLALEGPTTQDLTIPAAKADVKSVAGKEVATGTPKKGASPLVWIGIAAAGLVLLNFLQKKVA